MVSGHGCLKYVLKYVMKGSEMALIEMQIQNENGEPLHNVPFYRYDEFHQIRMARYVTSFEAFLSLWGVHLVKKSHTVSKLPLELFYSFSGH